MNWIVLNEAKVLVDFPTDLKPVYAAWLAANPDKAGRLAEITANTVAEFRSAIATDPANILDPNRAKLPENCIRSAEVIVIETLKTEMGQALSTADEQAMTRAEIFLRQIGYRLAQTVRIHGYAGGDSDGGQVEILGGTGNGYTPGKVLLRGGDAGSGSTGADIEISGGSGSSQCGTVIIRGLSSNGMGYGGILLDLSDANLKVQTDNMPTIYTGATEDVEISGVTLHFVRGIYTGHTGP